MMEARARPSHCCCALPSLRSCSEERTTRGRDLAEKVRRKEAGGGAVLLERHRVVVASPPQVPEGDERVGVRTFPGRRWHRETPFPQASQRVRVVKGAVVDLPGGSRGSEGKRGLGRF